MADDGKKVTRRAGRKPENGRASPSRLRGMIEWLALFVYGAWVVVRLVIVLLLGFLSRMWPGTHPRAPEGPPNRDSAIDTGDQLYLVLRDGERILNRIFAFLVALRRASIRYLREKLTRKRAQMQARRSRGGISTPAKGDSDPSPYGQPNWSGDKSWGDDRQGNWLARNGLALILGLLVVLLMGALIYLLMQLPEFQQP